MYQWSTDLYSWWDSNWKYTFVSRLKTSCASKNMLTSGSGHCKLCLPYTELQGANYSVKPSIRLLLWLHDAYALSGLHTHLLEWQLETALEHIFVHEMRQLDAISSLLTKHFCKTFWNHTSNYRTPSHKISGWCSSWRASGVHTEEETKPFGIGIFSKNCNCRANSVQ